MIPFIIIRFSLNLVFKFSKNKVLSKTSLPIQLTFYVIFTIAEFEQFSKAWLSIQFKLSGRINDVKL
nr:hypothetical protein [Mycoplasmopsis anatis]